MPTNDYDLLNKQPPKQVADARANRVAQVYQRNQTNTDPRGGPPQSQLPADSVTVTPDVVEELNKALYHLQQVVVKLRGGV